ncbi:MAG: RidA family protein [Lachnospiraceae bacterium]|nr:RidA family protein [Lachnospiraceae bacterium]
MKTSVYEKLKELGLAIPEAPAKGGMYAPCKKFGDRLIYVSGCGPVIGSEKITGKLGAEISMEEGKKYARQSMLNVLAVLERELGNLDRIKDCIKLTVFVASTEDFYDQPQVANGASGLLSALYGDDAGTPTRSAVGVNVLPGNIPVEIEGIFQI